MTDILLTRVIFVLAVTPSTGVVLVVDFKLFGHSTGRGLGIADTPLPVAVLVVKWKLSEFSMGWARRAESMPTGL